MEAVEYFRRTLDHHGELVRRIGADQWSAPTPDDEWDVRALTNHVTGELLWVPPLLDGKTIEEVGDRLDGDVLGDDPSGIWEDAATDAASAVALPDVAGRTVHLSFGDCSAADYLDQVGSDLLIHAWDLARGIGADDTMPDDLVAYCAGWFGAWEAGYREAGVIADAVPVADDADAQTRLLASFGRRAR
jgi:uncharacterized protein (TIGR03086 family)